jgi:hypothetical protein
VARSSRTIRSDRNHACQDNQAATTTIDPALRPGANRGNQKLHSFYQHIKPPERALGGLVAKPAEV